MFTLAWFLLLQVGDHGVAFAWVGLSLGVGGLYARGRVDFERPASALERSGLLVLLALLITSALGVAPLRSLMLSVPALGACLVWLLLARGDTKEGDEAWLAACVGLAALLQLALGAWQALRHPEVDAAAWVAQSGAHWLLVPNDIAWIACCLPLMAQVSQRTVPLILFCFVVFCLVCLWLHSRTAVVVAFASVGAYCALASGHWRRLQRWWAPLALLAVAVLVAAVVLIPSMQARLQLWRAAWELFLTHPLFGVGPHNFVLSYRQTAGLSTTVLVDPRLTPWPHNLWLEVAAELGVVGLLAVGGLIVACGRAVQRLLAATTDRLSFAALGALSGLLVASLVEASLLRTWLWITGAIVFGILARERRPTVAATSGSGK